MKSVRKRNEQFKKLRIIGWVLSFLVVAFLIFGSAMGKFIEWEGKAELSRTWATRPS